MDDVSIYTSCMSMLIPVDSILILLLPVESPNSIMVVGSFSKLLASVDRCWDANVYRRSSMLSILWLETIIYFTSCVVEFVCNSLLVLWNAAFCSWLMNCNFYCIALVITIMCPTAN